MTGGAAGSLLAQFFHFSNAERKTLMIDGASARMAAILADTPRVPFTSLFFAQELTHVVHIVATFYRDISCLWHHGGDAAAQHP